jgi:hypothetical protein
MAILGTQNTLLREKHGQMARAKQAVFVVNNFFIWDVIQKLLDHWLGNRLP